MVKKFTTNDELEILCEAMIKDFMKRKHYTNVRCVDIEAFVTEYLGIPIVYETFAEDDPGRIGFFSDGLRPLKVMRNGTKQEVLFPKNTIVIEKALLNPKESGRKRFVTAHEGAHLVIMRHIPAQSTAACFHSEFDPTMRYTNEMMFEMMNINEAFTNRAAAVFLMPRFLVERVLKKYNGGKKIKAYDGNVLAQSEKMLLQKMADSIGVSFSAFFTRLKELHLIEYHPIDEYVHENLAFGGDVN